MQKLKQTVFMQNKTTTFTLHKDNWWIQDQLNKRMVWLLLLPSLLIFQKKQLLINSEDWSVSTTFKLN